MQHANWTEANSRNAKRIWAEYQKQHDITERIGQTAGIDPEKWQDLVRRIHYRNRRTPAD